MNRKKAILCTLLALLILLALPGCTGDTADEVNAGDPESYTEAPPPPSDETSDEEPQFSFSDGLDENGFVQGLTALNYVDLFNYQAFEIPADVHYISEEHIQEILDLLLADHITAEEITDREVVDGDRVNIDFVGSVDGVEFAGGSTGEMGMYVTAGSPDFIDDFLDQIIGHMPGTVVNVEVTFPDDYFEESLAGADALFITTINHIQGEEIIPELTDAFVLEHIAPFHDLTTVADLIEDIQSGLQEGSINQYLQEYILDHVTVTSIPEQLLRYYEQAILQRQAEQGLQFGMDLISLLEIQGYNSIEEFLEDIRDEIEMEARFTLILQAVAEDANINASVQDVADFFLEHFGSEDFSMFEEMYGLPWLKQFIRNQMVMEYIIENAILL